MYSRTQFSSIMLERCWLRAWDRPTVGAPPQGREKHTVFPALAAVPSTGSFSPLHMTPGPKGSLWGLIWRKAPKGAMPSMGVWADGIKGRVVRSPSEAVSGPQSCQSPGLNWQKHTNTQRPCSFAYPQMCTHIPYTHMRTQIHTQTVPHTHTHFPLLYIQCELHRAGTQSSDVETTTSSPGSPGDHQKGTGLRIR